MVVALVKEEESYPSSLVELSSLIDARKPLILVGS